MKDNSHKKTFSLIGLLFKIVLFVAGGFLIWRYRKKVAAFIKNQNFIITAAYALLIGFIALFYRLIMALNWIIQQGH